jgi:hypothetical protein
MTEFDDTLTRLFAEAQEPLPAEDFFEEVAGRVNRERGRRAIRRAALALAVTGAAVALTPYVADGSLTVASHLGVWIPTLGNALASPVGWACSLAAVAWSVRRARGLR